MPQGIKISRARRSFLKAVGITAAAFAGTAGSYKPAAAKHDEENGSCFLRGTRIRAADGYRPIETLSVGDRVAAHFAGQAPITDISSFTLSRTGPAGTWGGAARPVRVKRGALGENLPAADICLTASHAVFMDGSLVPVGNLVNGTSIVLETAEGHDTLDFSMSSCAAMTYWMRRARPASRAASPGHKPACRCSVSTVAGTNFAHGCAAWLPSWWIDASLSTSFGTIWQSAGCSWRERHKPRSSDTARPVRRRISPQPLKA